MLVVDSGEKPYVFEALNGMGVDYIKKDIRFWFCPNCDRIYIDKQDQCECGGDLESDTVGDITNDAYSFIVERKKGMDLYNSLFESRIYTQMENLGKFFNGNVAIVFEGDLKEIVKEVYKRQKDLRIPTFKGRISQLYSLPATCMQYGISFIQVKTIKDTIKMCRYFDEKSQRPPRIRAKLKHFNDMMPKRQVIFQTPKGFGPKIALEIAKVYPSVFAYSLDLANEEPKTIAEKVKGLGVKGVEKSKEWFL